MNPFITLMRYVALIGVGIETYPSFNEMGVTEIWLIGFLIYAVNFQLRYFNLHHPTFRIFSFLIDLLFISLFYANLHFLSLFMGAIFIVDTFLLQKRNWAFFQCALFALLLLVLTELNQLRYEVFQLVFLVFLGFISFIIADYRIRSEQLEKEQIEFQHVMNEMQKNKDVMEQYMGSMRDLYTLKERNRLSRELHDSVGHSLSTIIIQLGAITKLAETKAPAAAQMSGALREFATKSMQQVREQLAEMKPDHFSRNQVFTAIDEMVQDYMKNTSIQVNFGISEQLWFLSEKQELLLYRAIQEFLSNTTKHAEASRINIFLHFNEQDLILTMKDNGKGTDTVVPHLGLLSIKERVEEVHGSCTVTTSPGNGFQLQLKLVKEQRGMEQFD
ncbi:sensor histidine kinase [Jeotgalibaca caeni]|uniref:sensor histidine kinase n=1 Tax=Jeotgalibaca caeni TaxID=3028623 RepID=UPI00237DD657|nr:sensor histidine kinase [Jeotgalibaca caeni]MDE1548437.1 sensor histidine kinase [Jeotgalibaca caeni]